VSICVRRCASGLASSARGWQGVSHVSIIVIRRRLHARLRAIRGGGVRLRGRVGEVAKHLGDPFLCSWRTMTTSARKMRLTEQDPNSLQKKYTQVATKHKGTAMPCYFFSGQQYIRVTRGSIDPGVVDLGYPASLNNWGWGAFGAEGVDAALSSGPVDYFFSGDQYIRVTRGTTGAGSVDPGYPAPISNWGWGSFGAKGIDAALQSGTKCYFFSGNQYIRVTRGDTGPGTVDAGYPAPISNWGWGEFGKNGIDAALNSGAVDYFFSGDEYIRVTRGDTGAGTVDPGYPTSIEQWGWGSFGASGINAALFSGTDTPVGATVTPPPRLGNNSNYFIHNNGRPLTGVVVTINIETDLTMKSATKIDGFSFQLNCYGAAGAVRSWQQFCAILEAGGLFGEIDTFDSTGKEAARVIGDTQSIGGGFTLAAGYQLKIALQTDAGNNITSATFSATDNHGKPKWNSTLQVGGVNLAPSPIVAMTLDLVGAQDASHTVFSAGSGALIYQASTPLLVGNDYPAFVARDEFTVEYGTSTYGTLPAGPNVSLSQHFGVTPDGSFI
jgi:hypothetical protein